MGGQRIREVRPSEREAQALREASMTIEQRLNLATMDVHLPVVDLHGMQRQDVPFEIDALLLNNPDKIVRIVYGYGSGVVSSEVMKYLRQISKGKSAKIEGFREDDGRASCVVKVK